MKRIIIATTAFVLACGQAMPAKAQVVLRSFTRHVPAAFGFGRRAAGFDRLVDERIFQRLEES